MNLFAASVLDVCLSAYVVMTFFFAETPRQRSSKSALTSCVSTGLCIPVVNSCSERDFAGTRGVAQMLGNLDLGSRG